jgi:hypothetical protein
MPRRGISWISPKSGTGCQREACNDEVRPPSGRRYRGGNVSAGGCGHHRRSARSQCAAVRPGRVRTLRDQFAAVRPQLVAQRLDQRVQTATGAPCVVDTPAGICAAVRTGGRTAAASPAAVGATNAAEMGRRRPALGLVRDLTAAQAISQLADAAQGLCERVAGGQTTTKTRLHGAQIE